MILSNRITTKNLITETMTDQDKNEIRKIIREELDKTFGIAYSFPVSQRYATINNPGVGYAEASVGVAAGPSMKLSAVAQPCQHVWHWDAMINSYKCRVCHECSSGVPTIP